MCHYDCDVRCVATPQSTLAENVCVFAFSILDNPGSSILADRQRRVILVTIATTLRRHRHLQEAPYALAALCDDRSSSSDIDGIKRALFSKNPCCLPPGVAREARMGNLPLADTNGVPPQWIFPWCVSVTTSLSDTERKHAVNSSFSTATAQCSSFDQMVANAVLSGARSAYTRQHPPTPDSAIAPVIHSVPCAGRVKDRQPRALPANMQFRQWYFTRKRMLVCHRGAAVNECSKDC